MAEIVKFGQNFEIWSTPISLVWKGVKKAADMELDTVADMEVDKVVDMVADMLVYFDIKVILCVFFWSFSSP